MDGQDIRNIKLSDLRNHIGIVQQDVYLFAGTIWKYPVWQTGCQPGRGYPAAKEANAHELL